MGQDSEQLGPCKSVQRDGFGVTRLAVEEQREVQGQNRFWGPLSYLILSPVTFLS